MTVHDYITNADWYHGLEPTDTKGKYYLIMTYHQLAEACEWIDTNFEDMFAKYIPNYGKFTPLEGYKFPKRVDKPQHSNQLSTYADQPQNLYPTPTTKANTSPNKWNHPPLYKNKNTENPDF